MLQIHLIADKSEILPAKKGRGKDKPKKDVEMEGEGDEFDFAEEPMFEDQGYKKPKSKPKKSRSVRWYARPWM